MEGTVRTLQAPVEDLLHEGATAEALAAGAMETWQGVEAALVPLVGGRGFAALVGRSLHLVRQSHGWLPVAPAAAPSAQGLFVSLRAALAAQPPGQAAAAHAAMIEAFCGVLASLIGGPLTERVLRPVDTPNGTAGDAPR